MTTWRGAAWVVWLSVAWACAAPAPEPADAPAPPPAAETSTPAEASFVVCQDPRPQACTREMRPVCAHTMNGLLETRPNGCSACADPSILGYRNGACG